MYCQSSDIVYLLPGSPTTDMRKQTLYIADLTCDCLKNFLRKKKKCLWTRLRLLPRMLELSPKSFVPLRQKNHELLMTPERKRHVSFVSDYCYLLTEIMRHVAVQLVWDTALQVRRLRVRFPTVSLELFIDTILLAAPWPWGGLIL